MPSSRRSPDLEIEDTVYLLHLQAGSLLLVPPGKPSRDDGSLKYFKHYLRHEYMVVSKDYCSVAAAAKSLQSCPTLWDPVDGGQPGSPVPGILQARTLEWVAIFFSNAWKGKVKVKSLSRVRLFATPWSAAYQAPPSMAFSRQEYWSGVPLPSPYCSVVALKTWGHLCISHVWVEEKMPFVSTTVKRWAVTLLLGNSQLHLNKSFICVC